MKRDLLVIAAAVAIAAEAMVVVPSIPSARSLSMVDARPRPFLRYSA